MLENTLDFGDFDHIWRNKPELPVANEENRKLEELLKEKKIEMEKLKVIMENNIKKGENIREHVNNLCQTVNYKQQLYKSRQHELEMEIHAEKLLERETSRLQQDIKNADNEINALKVRQKQREVAIAVQMEKREKLRSMMKLDEEALLEYLEKSAEMEKDNMALLKYTSEDDSKINELGIYIERLNRETYDKKNSLEDANTDVLIVQSELDRIQEEFHSAYNERNNLISHWEKVIHQIEQRNNEVNKLSENIEQLQEDESSLRRTLKEQSELLSGESTRNNQLERVFREKDNLATKLRNDTKAAFLREEDLKAELSTIRNVLHNISYQKQATENSVKQLEKQISQKTRKLEDIKSNNKKIEIEIETLSKETFEADHYTKELEKVLQAEKMRSISMQNEIANLGKEILLYDHEWNDLKLKEKLIDNRIKTLQAESRNLAKRIMSLDQVRIKQESDRYETESELEKVKQRLKKMYGVTNEEERRKIEKERAALLDELEQRQNAVAMLTEELKVMMEKINVSSKEMEGNKKLNSELIEKVKFMDFYVSNSQKSLKCCISRKEELLVQECLVRFQMKKFRKLLKNRNMSVASLQKSKLEFETIMKERTEELRHCHDLLEAESRIEEHELSLIRKKFQEYNDKMMKIQNRYKVILDAMGISEPGENPEIEQLLKAENEKRDLQYERDNLISTVLKREEELSALKNTIWLINAANEQFRQAIYPAGVNAEDGELLRNAEAQGRVLTIQMHSKKSELRTLEESVQTKQEKLEQEHSFCSELQDIIKDRETETESLSKELADLQTKIQRADRCNSRLILDIRNKFTHSAIEEDIRIHLLREMRRTVSDLLFSAVETIPDIFGKIKQLYEEAHLPLPSRTRSSLSLRSTSLSSFHSRASSSQSNNSLSGRSLRSEAYTPSIVTLGSFDD